MRFKLAAFTIAVLACALVLWPPRVPRNDLRITFIDVGQGDGILIQTPRGHAIMIDTGGRLERHEAGEADSNAELIGEKVVVPFLIRQGIHHVDAILLTHPHGDHVGGIAPILRTLGADVFFNGGQDYAGHAYRDALDEAKKRHVRIVAPHAGDLWQTDDGVRLHFLTDSGTPIDDPKDGVNENSLVAMLECDCGRKHPFRVLFMGDAGKLSENVLLAHHVDLHADVLKVGHHGSRFASGPDFLAAVGAHDAVISDGRHNFYHHPAPETLAALAVAGMRVWRTDVCGAITLDVRVINSFQSSRGVERRSRWSISAANRDDADPLTARRCATKYGAQD
ncbi:MAG TPA: MBL fold metallo-hydrolase [Candidatus Acidoferrales bacterium]|nr:MBL fold metallo-hydrolase [Candidatus Acidoferrales bacterium]